MTTTHAAAAGGDFLASARTVLDHLATRHPDVRWAVSRTVSTGHEVLAVSGAPAELQVGDVVEPPDDAGRVRWLRGPAGEQLGALWALGSPAPPPDPLVDVLVDLLTVILNADLAHIASARRSQLLHEQALSDELTGLLNRRGWTQVLESEPTYPDEGAAPSVIVLDLDRLKEVNDVQGHVAGDEYLQLTAVTVSAACREGDLVARLGGDEFAVLVEPSAADAAERLVERIREALDAAGVAASIGYAHCDDDSGLVRTWWRADQRMYRDKQRRRARQPGSPSAVVLP